jgi:isocitrate/isopropylmalate dehydrogenase
MLTNEKIAQVLEAAANYLDAVEAEKQAAVKAEREKLIAGIGEKYAAATGEDIPDNVLLKLADIDTELLGAVEKLAESKESDELGEAGDMADTSALMTVKEAADHADDRFLDWLIS